MKLKFLNIYCLRATLTFFYVKTYFLTFIESFESFDVNG